MRPWAWLTAAAMLLASGVAARCFRQMTRDVHRVRRSLVLFAETVDHLGFEHLQVGDAQPGVSGERVLIRLWVEAQLRPMGVTRVGDGCLRCW